MKYRLQLILIIVFLSQFCAEADKEYLEFYNKLKAEEAYIGFFAAEEKCISQITDEYLEGRKEFFLGIKNCKEDIEEFTSPFTEFLIKNKLLKEECVEEWERVLTILGYELYANMPIFEYSSINVIEHRSLVFAEYPNKKLELDLFIPKEPIDNPIPAVVCIHGGGWTVNKRIWFEPFAKYLADNGIAAVTIDYRMLPAVTLMECVYDSKAAVRWVRANADKYNIDPNRIGAIGASAGAQLVTLLGATANKPELEGKGGNDDVSSEVNAVVGIATPAFKIDDISDWEERFGLDGEQIKILSPYLNIDENTASLLLIHGTADETVDPQDSQDLYDKYKELGVHVELKWFPDEGHGFYEGNDRAIKLAATFFKQQFSK
ncbi:MAG: alpha/beta hydrolase [Melioribacteraceae bacterium]|nr:alpha/beta hydrolase [Melioribacteraceae bacterium]